MWSLRELDLELGSGVLELLRRRQCQENGECRGIALIALKGSEESFGNPAPEHFVVLWLCLIAAHTAGGHVIRLILVSSFDTLSSRYTWTSAARRI
jgi:hypothetical protein